MMQSRTQLAPCVMQVKHMSIDRSTVRKHLWQARQRAALRDPGGRMLLDSYLQAKSKARMKHLAIRHEVLFKGLSMEEAKARHLKVRRGLTAIWNRYQSYLWRLPLYFLIFLHVIS
jgi:hypothetical protein